MTKEIFRIYDDEWEEIVGIKQLSEHAHVQLECFIDELGLNIENNESEDNEQVLAEEIKYRLGDTSRLQEVKDIIKKYKETNKVFTVTESKLALELRNFEVEDMNIY